MHVVQLNVTEKPAQLFEPANLQGMPDAEMVCDNHLSPALTALAYELSQSRSYSYYHCKQ